MTTDERDDDCIMEPEPEDKVAGVSRFDQEYCRDFYSQLEEDLS